MGISERIAFQRGKIDYLEGNEPVDKWIRHRQKMKKLARERIEKEEQEKKEKQEIERISKEITENVIRELKKAFNCK